MPSPTDKVGRAEMGTEDFLRLLRRLRPRAAFRVGRRVMTDEFDRTPRRLEEAAKRWPLPSTQLVCVYRYANHAHVEAMLEGLDVRAALWALDRKHPALASKTIGTGPGGRFFLLNRLAAEMPEDGSHLVITDDDVSFVPGALATLVRTAAHFCVDVAQPAHGPLSHCSWDFNRFQPGVFGRRTLWVEVGPTLVFGPKARSGLLPFPDDSTMGWGQEVAWHLAAKDGLVLGIVDGVRVRHRGHVAASYDRVEAEAASAAALAKHGLTSTREMQVTVATLVID
jgi:hypothetical protein